MTYPRTVEKVAKGAEQIPRQPKIDRKETCQISHVEERKRDREQQLLEEGRRG